MKPNFKTGIPVLAALVLVACDSRQAGVKKDAQPTPAPNPTPALREETRKLEGAAAIGINSKQLRRNVDKLLDAQDEQNKKLKEALKPLDEQ
jgi:hypothetical protein